MLPCVSIRSASWSKSLFWMCSTANCILPLRRTCEVGLSQYPHPATRLFLDYHFIPRFSRYWPLQPSFVREGPCHLIFLQEDFMEPIRTQRWMWLGRSWWPLQRCRWVFNPFVDFIDDITPHGIYTSLQIIANVSKLRSLNGQKYPLQLIEAFWAVLSQWL